MANVVFAQAHKRTSYYQFAVESMISRVTSPTLTGNQYKKCSYHMHGIDNDDTNDRSIRFVDHAADTVFYHLRERVPNRW
jgi:hypothetical protein